MAAIQNAKLLALMIDLLCCVHPHPVAGRSPPIAIPEILAKLIQGVGAWSD
jgi:hypothetical protein